MRFQSPVHSVELTILFTAFIAVTYGFGVYLFASVLPDMRASLAFGYSEAGAMTALAQVGFLVAASQSAGWIARLGAPRLVLWSVVACCAGLVGMALSFSVWQVAVCLWVMGGAAAAVWVPMVAVVQKAIGPQHQGKVLGLMSSGTAYGVFVNGMAIPWLLPLGGWRLVWVFVAVLTALLVVWGFVRLGSPSHQPGQPADREAGKEADKEAGVAHAVATPQQHSDPGLWDLLRQRLPRKVLALMFLSGLACMPTQNYLTAWMREELGYSVAQAGNAWSVIGTLGMVGGFAFGALADRISVRRALVLAFAMLALSVLAFLWHPGIAAMYAGAALFGLAFNAIFGLVPAFVSLNFPQDQATRVFAWSNVLLGLGSMLGNLLGGVVRDVLHSFVPLYIAALVLAVLLCTLALSLTDRAKEAPTTGTPAP